MPALLALMTLAYVLSQFYRAFLAVLARSCRQSWGASAADLSNASGLWFLVFAAMQFPVGGALDRYGPRRTVVVLFGLFATLGALTFGLASAPWPPVSGDGIAGDRLFAGADGQLHDLCARLSTGAVCHAGGRDHRGRLAGQYPGRGRRWPGRCRPLAGGRCCGRWRRVRR